MKFNREQVETINDILDNAPGPILIDWDNKKNAVVVTGSEDGALGRLMRILAVADVDTLEALLEHIENEVATHVEMSYMAMMGDDVSIDVIADPKVIVENDFKINRESSNSEAKKIYKFISEKVSRLIADTYVNHLT